MVENRAEVVPLTSRVPGVGDGTSEVRRMIVSYEKYWYVELSNKDFSLFGELCHNRQVTQLMIYIPRTPEPYYICA